MPKFIIMEFLAKTETATSRKGEGTKPSVKGEAPRGSLINFPPRMPKFIVTVSLTKIEEATSRKQEKLSTKGEATRTKNIN